MEWRKIPTYPEHYEINRQGEVRSLRHYGKDQIKTLKATFQVYWFVGLKKILGDKTLPTPVHRLHALAFIPREEGKNYVDHINRDKTDNRIENLRWTTQTQNCVNRPPRSATPHIYHDPRRTLHPYSVRVWRENRQIFFYCGATMEDAVRERDKFLTSLGQHP